MTGGGSVNNVSSRAIPHKLIEFHMSGNTSGKMGSTAQTGNSRNRSFQWYVEPKIYCWMTGTLVEHSVYLPENITEKYLRMPKPIVMAKASRHPQVWMYFVTNWNYSNENLKKN